MENNNSNSVVEQNNTNKSINDFSFEKDLNKLEEIVSLLDSGDAPLDEMISKYEKGMQLANNLRTFLANAEQKVIDISKNYIETSEETNNE